MAAAAQQPIVAQLKDLRKTLEAERSDVSKKFTDLGVENRRLQLLVADLRGRVLDNEGLPIEPQAHAEILFSESIAAAYGPECAAIDPRVRFCDPKFGDAQINAAMSLKAQVGTDPKTIAANMISNLRANELIESSSITGPGFVNIRYKDAYLAKVMRHLHQTAGTPQPAPFKETVVIDYSSPNVAKEMHVGHLRSTVIGDALVRLFEYRGHTVIRQNHIGDWGTQFGMLTQMMIDTGAQEVEGSKLNDLYKQAKKRFDADEDFKERSRKRVVALQSGDAETVALWTRLVEASRVYFNQVYDMLGVTLKDSDVRGESSYNGDLKNVVEALRKSKIVHENEGATVAYCEGFNNRDGSPLPFIIQKGDGGFGYASTDLAAIRHRCHTLHATRILYVVDARQSDHFAQVFDVAKRAGFLQNARAEHIMFGTIMGPDRKPFKTRDGETVKLMDLINEAVSRAYESACKGKETDKAAKATESQIDEVERREISRRVGVGAIKYFDLSGDRIKDYVFSFDSMLSFDGNTAPYLQYAYTRIRSIFRKDPSAIISADTDLSDIVYSHPMERQLVLKCSYYNRIVDNVLNSCEPHLLCTYLYELTTLFHKFYTECPVLKSEGVTRKSRVLLCDVVARLVQHGLGCLGIEVMERM